jgi:hypothetical protein
MSQFRTRLLGRPIIVLALVSAVLIGTFTGVGFAATRKSSGLSGPSQSSATSSKAASTAAKIVFHPLQLLNGAKSQQAWGTGPPQYAVSGGVVYFAGSISAPQNQSLPAFVMPAGARPGYYDCFSIYSANNANTQAVAALHIYANGKAYLQGKYASIFTSLTGVSFVVGY